MALNDLNMKEKASNQAMWKEEDLDCSFNPQSNVNMYAAML